MSVQKRNRDITTNSQDRHVRGTEMIIFFLASAAGIYGIGQGLAGFYVQGQQISLFWLAVTGLAFFVLFAQMGRVHDTWPRRLEKAALETPNTGALPETGPSEAVESK